MLRSLAARGTSMLVVTHELAALEDVVTPHRVPGRQGASTSTATPATYAAHLAGHSTGSGHHHDGRDAAARPAAVLGSAPLDPSPGVRR